MRNITKTITRPIGGSPMEFRLTKLDAFSGVRLLKILSTAKTEVLQDLLLSLPEAELESIMRTCLRNVSALLPAGPIRVLEGESWGVPELEYDAWSCLQLTQEVLSWTLEGFFPESGSPSEAAPPPSSRPKPPTSTN